MKVSSLQIKPVMPELAIKGQSQHYTRFSLETGLNQINCWDKRK